LLIYFSDVSAIGKSEKPGGISNGLTFVLAQPVKTKTNTKENIMAIFLK
jgi:hypothetical protein